MDNPILTCENCGNEFERKRKGPNPKYCGAECRRVVQRAKRFADRPVGNCQCCGKQLNEAQRRNSKYCGVTCQRKHYKQEQQREWQELREARICRRCRGPIPAERRRDAIYCSIKCQEHGKKYLERKAKRDQLRCQLCGKKIINAGQGGTKYCSSVCRERARVARDPEEARERFRRNAIARRYGVTVEWYDQAVKDQKGVCAICGDPPGKRALAVDHDHDTGMVRQLLCGRCNQALGLFREDAELLREAISYLDRWTLRFRS